MIQIAKNLGIGKDKMEGANWLMAVMALETKGTFDPAKSNGLGYYGLIQFGSDAAKSINTTTDELRKMTVLEQLDYVEKHIKFSSEKLAKKKIKNLTGLYLSVLLPELIGKSEDKDYVLWTNKREAYYNNPGFHKEEGEWKNKVWLKEYNNKGDKIYKRGYKETVLAKTYMWEVTLEIESWKSKGVAKSNKCKTDSSTCKYGTKSGSWRGNWHEPVDNPQITIYNSYGNEKPQSGAFGYGRNSLDGSKKAHRGLDLFAKKGENVYASLDGEIVQAISSNSGYGNVVKIKVNKKDLEGARLDYNLQYSNEKDKGPNYAGENRYLIYAHLDSIEVIENQKVKAGDKIGTVGKTGNASNASKKNTHLHFEITCKKSSSSDDYKNLRYGENPAFYVKLNKSNKNVQKNNTD